MQIQENIEAPDFELPDSEGKMHKLSDYRGQPVVLYFYPKDDTPGCTTEACEFRDDYDVYESAGVKIIGVSPDSVKSHAKFKNKHDLPFTLLADEDHAVSEQFGVWGKKRMYGKEYFGVLRTTFLIDKDGLILKVLENVKPKGHSSEVLSILNK